MKKPTKLTPQTEEELRDKTGKTFWNGGLAGGLATYRPRRAKKGWSGLDDLKAMRPKAAPKRAKT